MTGSLNLPSDTSRTLPAAGPRIAAMRGTVGAALLFSAAAHAGAVYWAVSAMPQREMTMSAGASVAIEVVLVEGPGAPSARASDAPENEKKVEDRVQDRTAETAEPILDHALSADRRESESTPEQPALVKSTPFAPAESAPFAAAHPATEAPTAEPLDPFPEAAVSPPPPPPPRPAKESGDNRPTTQIASATATEPTPAASAATAGTAGQSERTDESDGKQAASPRADNPAPAYPYAARLRGQQGRVLLQVEVLPSGKAGAVAVAQSSGYESLDRAARQAVQRWRFHPALRNGQAVAASVQVPVRFAFR
jgi:protein TonB